MDWSNFKPEESSAGLSSNTDWSNFIQDKPVEPRGVGGFLKDTAIDIAKGVVGFGESTVGLANLGTFGLVGKAAEAIGYDPKQTNAFLSGLQTDARQQSEREVDQEKGFWNHLAALGTHPDVLFGNIVQSLPGTVGAGAAGGLLAKRLAATAATEATALKLTGSAAEEFIVNKVKEQTFKIATAASAAEGAQSAGSIAEAGRQSGRDWSEYVAPALAAGLGTAAIGMVSGELGRRLKIGDIETDIAARSAGVTGAAVSRGGVVRRVGGEMAKEALAEEMPQSYQEKAFENLATGRPWQEGTSEAAASGLMAGLGMAGGHAMLTGRAQEDAASQAPEEPSAHPTTPATPPAAPTPPASILDAKDVDSAIKTFGESIEKTETPIADVTPNTSLLESLRQTGQQWQDLGVTPTGEVGSIEAQKVGQQWQDIAPEQSGSLEQQRLELEQAAAERSRARDAQLASMGQQWQDLGITNPADDLQAQKMGMREDINGTSDTVQSVPVGRSGDDGANPTAGMATGAVDDQLRGSDQTGRGADSVGQFGELPGEASQRPITPTYNPQPTRLGTQITATAGPGFTAKDVNVAKTEQARTEEDRTLESPAAPTTDIPRTAIPGMVEARGVSTTPASDPRLTPVSKRNQGSTTNGTQTAQAQQTETQRQAPAATDSAKPATSDGVATANEAGNAPGTVEVSRYNGKFGKGMNRDAARLEAQRIEPKPASTEVAATEHAGVKIYPITFKGELRWAVQSEDNRANGKVLGDTIHTTLDEAKQSAEEQVRRVKSKQERDSAYYAEQKLAQDKKDANKALSISERSANANLDKPTKLHPNAGLGTGTRREAMQMAVDQDRHIEAKMVEDMAAKKKDRTTLEMVRARGYILGASNENIPLVKQGIEAQARLKANKYEKPEYRVYDGRDNNGSFREITKTEYDYAQSLKEKKPPALANTAQPAIESVARAVQQKIAANRRKAREKSRKEYEAKGWKPNSTPESEQTDYDTEVNAKLSEYSERHAAALLGDNPLPLIEMFVNGNFEASEDVFKEITGVKIRGLSAADKKAALYKWANWTPEQIAKAESDAKDRTDRATEKNKQEDAKTRVMGEWLALDRLQIGQPGEKGVTGQEFVLQAVANGYDKAHSQKKGAATIYGLTNGKEFTTLKNGAFTDFVKAAIAFGGLDKTLEYVNPPKPQKPAGFVDRSVVVGEPDSDAGMIAKAFAKPTNPLDVPTDAQTKDADASVDALTDEEAIAVAQRMGKKIPARGDAKDAIKQEHPDDIAHGLAGDTWDGKNWKASDKSKTAFTYINGDRAEYTGKTEMLHGGLFHEVKFTEGAKAGKTAITQRAPDGTNPAQKGPTPSSGIVTPQIVSAKPASEAAAILDAANVTGVSGVPAKVGRFDNIQVPDETTRWMGFDGRKSVKADLQALAQRHSEYYESGSGDGLRAPNGQMAPRAGSQGGGTAGEGSVKVSRAQSKLQSALGYFDNYPVAYPIGYEKAEPAERTLTISDLLPTQDSIHPDGVDKYKDNADGAFPEVVLDKKSGKHILLDGHHRVAAAIQRGESSVRVNVVGSTDKAQAFSGMESDMQADWRASHPEQSDKTVRDVVAGKDVGQGVAMFSRSATPTSSPFTIAQARAAVGKRLSKVLAKLEAKGLVTLVQTEQEAIDAAARAVADKTGEDIQDVKASLLGGDADIKRSADGRIQGFYVPETKQAYLIADNLTAQTTEGVLMHEVGIHMAADGSMASLFSRALELVKIGGKSPFMQRVSARMTKAGETSGEEAAAYIAEEYENDQANAPGSVQNWIASVYAAVRAWMFRKGIIIQASNLTPADIAAVARANAKSLADGSMQAAGSGFDFSHSMGDEKLLAPNGKPSKLTPGQYAQVRTPEFKRWFGDWENDPENASKAVDENGEPLVVYHGGTVGNVFDASHNGTGSGREGGFFFTPDIRQARDYAGSANVKTVYLNIKNPLFTDSQLGSVEVMQAKADSHDGYWVIEDGLVQESEIVVFNPTQIKSAIGNNGQFDPKNADIRFSRSTFARQTQDENGNPEINTPSVTLKFSQPTERLEFIPTTDNQEMFNMAIYSPDGVFQGVVEVLFTDGKPSALYDILITDDMKGAGFGTKTVEALIEASEGAKLGISNIVPSAQGFWEKLGIGVQNHEQGAAYDGTVTRESFASSPAGKKYGRAPSMGRQVQGARDGNASRTIRYSRATTAAIQSSVTDTLKAVTSPLGTVSLWDKTVGTKYNLATKDKDFKRVFDAFRQQTDDTAHYAIEAEKLAPDVLLRMDSMKDVFGALFQHSLSKQEADLKAISGPLFANIEGEKGIKQVRYTDAQLAKQFKLTPKQILMYHQVRGAVDTSIDRLAQTFAAQMGQTYGMDISKVKNYSLEGTVEAVKQHIQDEHDKLRGAQAQQVGASKISAPTVEDTKALLTRLDQMEQHATFLKDSGYMPAMRFGEFAVTVLDANDEVLAFHMFDTKTEAKLAAMKLRKKYPTSRVESSVMNPKQYAMFKGVSPETVELFAKFTGMDSNADVQQYIALSKSARSVAQRELQRKGTAGFSEDVTRVLASFLTSNARQAAINMNHGEVTDALSSKALARKGDVQAEAQKLDEYMSNPIEEARRLRGFMFMHFLGGSFASAIVNLTQPVLQTTPYLHQFAGAKIARIMAAAAKMAATGKIDNQQLRDAAKRAAEDGITEPNEIHQLMADAGNTGLGSNIKVRAIIKAWGGLFSATEAYNRRLTFLAAYQTAMETNQADPYAFAQKAVIETQGLYSKVNRPNWARGAVGATVFTFKQFSIAYMEFLSRLPLKQKILALTILTLAAGLQGLPGADDLEDLIDTLGQSLGYNINSKKLLRKKLIDALGKDIGTVLDVGVLSALSAVDVQGRLGMGNLIPGTGMFKPSETDKSKSMAELAGPIAGLLTSAQKAVTRFQTGDVAGSLGEVAPVAVRNLIKGLEMHYTGTYKDAKGYKVTAVTAADSFIKMLGFQPSDVAMQTRALSDELQSKNMTTLMESLIAERMAQGYHEKDFKKVADARRTLNAWNENNPESRIVINPNQIRSRVVKMEQTRAQRFIKTVPKEQRRQVAEELS